MNGHVVARRRRDAVSAPPSADRIIETLCGYQRTAALSSALELGLFTAIDEGATTAAALARRCGASERGVRMLCDYLTVIALLAKVDGRYDLVPESAYFLSRRSPAYLGTAAGFYARSELRRNFESLTDAVKAGGTAAADFTAADAAVWVEFARTMPAMMARAVQVVADLLGPLNAGAVKVLDVAASHGAFGIALARRNPLAEVTAVDWEPVLAVAKENALRARVADRYRLLPGDALTLDLDGEYRLVLVMNFLHHFDEATCVRVLRKLHGVMAEGGGLALLELVAAPDRVSPPLPAAFGLTMLACTPGGDVYSRAELQSFLDDAGFHDVSFHPVTMAQTAVLARR